MNTYYKKLIAILSVAIGRHEWHEWIMSALEENDTPRSKSAVQGWAMSPDNRKFRAMTADDMQDVLDAVYKKINGEQL